MREPTTAEREDRLIGRGIALRECAMIVGQCAEDGTGIEGVLAWLESEFRDFSEEVQLING